MIHRVESSRHKLRLFNVATLQEGVPRTRAILGIAFIIESKGAMVQYEKGSVRLTHSPNSPLNFGCRYRIRELRSNCTYSLWSKTLMPSSDTSNLSVTISCCSGNKFNSMKVRPNWFLLQKVSRRTVMEILSSVTACRR